VAGIKDKVQINIPFHMLWDGAIDRFVDLGLNPEIGLDANAFDKFGRSAFDKIAKQLHQHSLAITLHGPFIDLSAGSPDPDIRAITRRRFEQVLEVVPIFTPKTVVCHFGYDQKRHFYFRDKWIEISLEIWSWLGEQLKNSGCQLMIENVYEYSPNDMRIVFERLQDHNVGFCLDTGHQAAFSQTPLDGWLDSLGPYLGQLHLHDNRGSWDEHLAIGLGSIDFEAFLSNLKTLRPDPPIITLEPHSEEDLWPGLDYLEQIWPW
jgi:sugar phosphate isomerase/epimerase